MANTTKTSNTGDADAKAATTKTDATAKTDAVTRIGGAINKTIAEEKFGAGNARMVFDTVAANGGYGSFNDAEYNGGVTLAIPDPERAENAEQKKIAADVRAKINEALKDLE